ncbi:MAG: hypothetical protein OXC62_02090 [Aestuariivita sp.]|nr:hypothetical protein [Aestuariivita sp.]
MGLEFIRKMFEEQFLIADVEMTDSLSGSNVVPERWFWVRPTFSSKKFGTCTYATRQYLQN